MSLEFLTRLFWACACQENYSAPGLNLGELYEQVEDAEKASSEFSKALFATDLTFAEKDQLESMNVVCFQAYELQGFINGCRLGMRMAAELGGAAEKSAKIADLLIGDGEKKCP